MQNHPFDKFKHLNQIFSSYFPSHDIKIQRIMKCLIKSRNTTAGNEEPGWVIKHREDFIE